MTLVISKQEEARKALIRGAAKIHDPVASTFGPLGNGVLIKTKYGFSYTKDGANVVKGMNQLGVSNDAESVGAQMLQNVTKAVVEEAGDGTTGATILTYAGLRSANAVLSSATEYVNRNELKMGIEAARKFALDYIEKRAIRVNNIDTLVDVATVAANYDSALGKQIAEIVWKVGVEGAITVEEGHGTETTYSILEGLSFNSGFMSPYFVTNHAKRRVELSNLIVVIINKKISAVGQILGMLDMFLKKGKQILMLVSDMEAEVLMTCVANKTRGILPIAVVKLPGFGNNRDEQAIDIAAATGATVISDENYPDITKVGEEVFGRADKAYITEDLTVIINKDVDHDSLQERKEQIRLRKNEAKSDYDRKNLEQRLARLAGGVCTIKVGANLESEMASKKDVIDDAVNACKAALVDGIVPGGSKVLVEIAKKLEEIKENEKLGEFQLPNTADVIKGLTIVIDMLRAPIIRMLKNASMSYDAVLKKLETEKGNIGFDLRRREYVDMVQAGVIDSTRCHKVAINKSIAAVLEFIFCHYLVYEIEDKSNNNKSTIENDDMDMM